MPSTFEAIMDALQAGLAGAAAEVKRNEVLPTRIRAGGLIILRDGDPGEPEVSMSPLRYHYEHRAAAELYAEGGVGLDRDGAFDALKLALGAALAADRTLGGTCEWIEAEAPETEDLATEGGSTVKAALVPLRIHYSTHDPLA